VRARALSGRGESAGEASAGHARRPAGAACCASLPSSARATGPASLTASCTRVGTNARLARAARARAEDCVGRPVAWVGDPLQQLDGLPGDRPAVALYRGGEACVLKGNEPLLDAAFVESFEPEGVSYTPRVEEAVEKFSVIKSLQAIDASQVVVFLLDISSSMRPYQDAARRDLLDRLAGLRSGDTFNVVAFATERYRFAPEPIATDDSTLTSLESWLTTLPQANGTCPLPALEVALATPGAGSVVLISDKQRRPESSGSRSRAWCASAMRLTQRSSP